jgi:hypothetical protein
MQAGYFNVDVRAVVVVVASTLKLPATIEKTKTKICGFAISLHRPLLRGIGELK